MGFIRVDISYQEWKIHVVILPYTGPCSQGYGFSVIMYWCESWTGKKVECWRIDAFKLWCWRRLLRVPWAAKRWNQSILKEMNADYSLERLMLNLQYFVHLMRRADLLEKPLLLGKIEGRRRRGQQRMRWLDNITDSVDTSLSKLQKVVEDRGAWYAAVHGVGRNWVTEQQHYCLYLSPGQRAPISLALSSTGLGYNLRGPLCVAGQAAIIDWSLILDMFKQRLDAHHHSRYAGDFCIE